MSARTQNYNFGPPEDKIPNTYEQFKTELEQLMKRDDILKREKTEMINSEMLDKFTALKLSSGDAHKMEKTK